MWQSCGYFWGRLSTWAALRLLLCRTSILFNYAQLSAAAIYGKWNAFVEPINLPWKIVCDWKCNSLKSNFPRSNSTAITGFSISINRQTANIFLMFGLSRVFECLAFEFSCRTKEIGPIFLGETQFTLALKLIHWKIFTLSIYSVCLHFQFSQKL